MADRPLLLIDSASMYYRAFYALPESMTAPDGRPVNAVRGFLDILARLMSARGPADLVCCWDDDWRPQWRVNLIPSYKTHRLADVATGGEEEPDTLSPQIGMIAEVLAALGICRVGADGFEADDVIATLAAGHRGPVEIATGDRDLFQLVDDTRPVRVLYPVTKGGFDVITDAVVVDRYAVPGAGYADLSLMRGDPSDGLPGVPGVGEKTAARLLNSFGSMAGILAAAQDPSSAITPAVRRSLLDSRDYIMRADRVVRLRADVPLPTLSTRIPRTPADPEQWAHLVTSWGLAGSAGRLEKALQAQPTDV